MAVRLGTWELGSLDMLYLKNSTPEVVTFRRLKKRNSLKWIYGFLIKNILTSQKYTMMKSLFSMSNQWLFDWEHVIYAL